MYGKVINGLLAIAGRLLPLEAGKSMTHHGSGAALKSCLTSLEAGLLRWPAIVPSESML